MHLLMPGAPCSVNSQSQKLMEKLARKDKRRRQPQDGLAAAAGQDAELAWLLENGMQPLVDADQVNSGSRICGLGSGVSLLHLMCSPGILGATPEN